jgi:hypothetical protein
MSRPRHGNRRTANRIDSTIRKTLSQMQEHRHMICASNKALEIGTRLECVDGDGKTCSALVLAHADATEYRRAQRRTGNTEEEINKIVTLKPFFYVISFD